MSVKDVLVGELQLEAARPLPRFGCPWMLSSLTKVQSSADCTRDPGLGVPELENPSAPVIGFSRARFIAVGLGRLGQALMGGEGDPRGLTLREWELSGLGDTLTLCLRSAALEGLS